MGDLGLILGWEDLLEKFKGYPLQYSGLETSMGWITKGQIGLSNFHSLLSAVHMLDPVMF